MGAGAVKRGRLALNRRAAGRDVGYNGARVPERERIERLADELPALA